MNREEYMKQLAYLLQDVSESERDEALQYYQDYFDDAGESEEANVISTLGSPEKVAAMIKDGLSGSDTQAGEYTDNGFKDERFREDNKVPEPRAGSFSQNQSETHNNQGDFGGGQYRQGQYYQQGQYHQDRYQKDRYQKDGFQKEQSYRYDNPKGESGDRKQKSTGTIILIVILCVFGIPIILPLAGGAVGLLLGILGAIFGAVIAIFACGFAAVVTGVVSIGVGIAQMFISPATGLLLIGGGMLCLSVSILFIIFTVWLVKTVVPGFLRWITNLCGNLFRRGRKR